MCNAHNHPPSCDCGWGGVWYGNQPYAGCGWVRPNEPRPRTMGEQKGTFSAEAAGFAVPNARCPVCGTSVFFYQSPYGGRVYFDSLGPPWPKHPCTTHEYLASSRDVPWQGGYSSWHGEGWKPLRNVSTGPGPSSAIYQLSGIDNNLKNRQVFFAADELVMCEIVRFKPRAPGEVYISILDYDTVTHRWQTWSGIAYVQAENAATRVGMLHKTIFPGEAVPPKPTEPEKPRAKEKLPAPKRIDIPKPAPSSSPPAVADTFQNCPVCKQLVLKKNLLKHIRRVHDGSLTPLAVPPPSKKNKRRKLTSPPRVVTVTIKTR